MKQIMNWDETTQTYKIRVASKREEEHLQKIEKLMKEIKSIYDGIERGAEEQNVSIDFFIDCNCWGAWIHSCHLAQEIEKLAENIINIDPYKYVHTI